MSSFGTESLIALDCGRVAMSSGPGSFPAENLLELSAAHPSRKF